MSDTIRVVVVDDHALVRAGVKAEIAGEVDVVGEADDVEGATGLSFLKCLANANDCRQSRIPGRLSFGCHKRVAFGGQSALIIGQGVLRNVA